MGRGLLEDNPLFGDVIRRCDHQFSRYVRWSLVTELQRGPNQSRMDETSIAQPSLFAIQIALAELYIRMGLAPDRVIGHSVGEIAAAYVSGGLSFADACCVAMHRGRTMDAATSRGGMLAVGLGVQEITAWLDDHDGPLSIAAINSPHSVTISGHADAVESLATRLEQARVFCRRLNVEYAFHSAQMDPVRQPLLRSLASIAPEPPTTEMVSTENLPCSYCAC